MSAKAKEPKEVKAPKPVEHKSPVVESPKEEVKPVETPPANPVEHTEVEHAHPVVENVETSAPAVVEEPAKPEQPKDEELDVQDGRRLDQNVEAPVFDEKAEEKAAHAKAPKVEERVEHAIVNPNGLGNEWPRG